MGTKFLEDDDITLIDDEEVQENNLEPPSQYKVVLINDDYTPMDFVVRVLQEIFRLEQRVANQVMLEIHEKGKGVAGVYTHEIAETRQAQVISFARKNEHPLIAVLEKA